MINRNCILVNMNNQMHFTNASIVFGDIVDTKIYRNKMNE